MQPTILYTMNLTSYKKQTKVVHHPEYYTQDNISYFNISQIS